MHRLVTIRSHTETFVDIQGELVRQDVTEDQAGVPMTTVIQIVNIDNCEPVSDMMLEIWHCNCKCPVTNQRVPLDSTDVLQLLVSTQVSMLVATATRPTQRISIRPSSVVFSLLTATVLSGSIPSSQVIIKAGPHISTSWDTPELPLATIAHSPNKVQSTTLARSSLIKT